jgi:transcriptional regulator with XRE-family HTH domain
METVMYQSTLKSLRLARINAGLTQFLLAKRAHLSASRISLLERGHDDPTDAERASLARVLGTPPDQLFPAPVAAEHTTAEADATASC